MRPERNFLGKDPLQTDGGINCQHDFLFVEFVHRGRVMDGAVDSVQHKRSFHYATQADDRTVAVLVMQMCSTKVRL